MHYVLGVDNNNNHISIVLYNAVVTSEAQMVRIIPYLGMGIR